MPIIPNTNFIDDVVTGADQTSTLKTGTERAIITLYHTDAHVKCHRTASVLAIAPEGSTQGNIKTWWRQIWISDSM